MGHCNWACRRALAHILSACFLPSPPTLATSPNISPTGTTFITYSKRPERIGRLYAQAASRWRVVQVDWIQGTVPFIGLHGEGEYDSTQPWWAFHHFFLVRFQCHCNLGIGARVPVLDFVFLSAVSRILSTRTHPRTQSNPLPIDVIAPSCL